MKTLGIDTSTLMATCALIDENKVLGEYSLNQDMSHSEKLIPMVKETLDSLDLEPKDIDLYGVSVGPGSFTGLRIGVATIKALAHLFNKPVVGVSTLEALAYNLAHNDIIVPMIDARRDRVYTAIYSWENEGLKEILEPSIYEIRDLLDLLGKYDSLVVNGDGVIIHKDIIRETLGDRVGFASLGQNSTRAASIAELARKKYSQGQRDDYFSLAPDYLRPSQAERELNLKKEEPR